MSKEMNNIFIRLYLASRLLHEQRRNNYSEIECKSSLDLLLYECFLFLYID